MRVLPWVLLWAVSGCWRSHDREVEPEGPLVDHRFPASVVAETDADMPPTTALDAARPDTIRADASAPVTGDAGTPDAGLPEEESWTDIAVEHGLSCGVRGGGLYCWGAGSAAGSALQVGEGNSQPVPRRIADGDDWQRVAIGGGHACAIRAGALYCWGPNDHGELGLDDRLERARPTRVGAMTDWHAVALGVDHTCGLRSGVLHCWGRTWNGLLESDPGAMGLYGGATLLASGPHKACIAHAAGIRCVPGGALTGPRSDWERLAADDVVLAIRAGELYAEGTSHSGQLGLGADATSADVLTRVGDTESWTDVAANHDRACGVRGGQLLCWGASESNGGERRTPDVFELRLVSTDQGWERVSLGQWHACGIRNGRAYCWGCNYNGELGSGSVDENPWPACQDTPRPVAMPE